jgi:hypothetical protein
VLTYRPILRFQAPDRPCVVCAAVIRAIPSGVRGPVLRPPCILHRPFAIAGAQHGQPVVRARAPQRGASLRSGLPLGLPRRQPLGPSRGAPGRGATGSIR